ncbi:hypothetical protein AB0K09_16035 [Streptomyces sp. NPDC049577]
MERLLSVPGLIRRRPDLNRPVALLSASGAAATARDGVTGHAGTGQKR